MKTKKSYLEKQKSKQKANKSNNIAKTKEVAISWRKEIKKNKNKKYIIVNVVYK